MDSYEKLYKEALEKARDMLSYKEVRKEDMEYLFPELAESEDERIRKELIDFVKSRLVGFPDCKRFTDWLEKQEKKDILDDAILLDNNEDGLIAETIKEKQGKQESAEEVEPKFKVGDIIKKIATGDIVTINEVDVKNQEYRLTNTGFIPFNYEHLWELVEQKPAEWSEDEKIRKQIKAFIKSRGSQITQSKTDVWLAWLEKQGKCNTYNSIWHKVEPGDYVLEKTLICKKNGEIDLVKDTILSVTDAEYALPISSLGIPKSLEKQKEHKPLVIPKFREGDFIRYKTNPDDVERVDCVRDDHYILDIKDKCTHVLFTCQDLWELVEQNPTERSKENKPKFEVGDWVVIKQ